MPTEQVVTDIIVTGKFEGEADVVAGAGGAERAVDGFTDAQKRTGAAAAETGQRLQETARSYSAAARAADTYLARQSPAIAAQIQIAKELANVERAMGGVERQALKGAISADDQAQRMALLGSRYREVTAAAAGLRDGTVSVGEAMAVLRTEAERAADAQAKLAAESQQMARAAQAYRDQVDPLGAAQREYNRILAETTKLQIAGLISDKEYIAATNQARAVLEKRTAELDGSAQAARDAAAAQAQLATAEQDAIRRAQAYRDAIDPLGVAQRAHNETLKEATQLQIVGLISQEEYIELTNRSLAALDKKKAELDGSAQAAREAAAAEAQLAAQAKQWIAVADPAAHAQAKLNEARELGEKLVAAGLVTQPQFTAGLKNLGEQAGRSGVIFNQFGIQAFDVFSQLQAGAPVFTTLAQQLSQIAQIAAIQYGALNLLRSAWAAVISPIGLAVAAIAAVTAGTLAFLASNESTQRQLLATQTALRATRSDYVAMGEAAVNAAKAVASATPGLSRGDAAGAARSIAGAFNFRGTQSDLEALIKTANDLAAVMGKSVPDAAKDVARALDEPGKVAQDLAERRFPGMSFALADTIQKLEEQGKSAEAAALMLDTVKAAVDGASQSNTALQQTLADISKGFENIAVYAVDYINIALGKLRELGDQAAKARAEMKAQGGPLMPWQTAAPPPAAIPGQPMAGTKDIQRWLEQNSEPGRPLPVPPIPPLGGASYQAVNTAVGAAIRRVNASTDGQIAGHERAIEADRVALAALAAQGVTTGKEFDALTQDISINTKAIEDARKKTETHATSLQKQSETVDAQIRAQRDLEGAYAKGDAAVQQVIARQTAEKQIISDGILPTSAKYERAVEDLTVKLVELARQTGATDYRKQIEATNEATDAQLRIAGAWDGSAESLTHLQNLETARALAIKDHLTPGQDEYNKKVEEYADALDRGSAASTAFRQAQQSVQALSDVLGNAFDRLAQSMSDAFLTGAGQAVNWGNILRSVFGSVATEIAQLALLNPILNELIPSTSGPRPTLGSALSVLGNGSASGSGGGSGGLFGGLNNLLTAGGAVDKVSGGGLSDLLGINDLFGGVKDLVGGLFQPSGFFGSNGAIAGILNSGLFGTSAFEASALSANAALAAEGFGAGGSLGVASAQAAAANAVAPTGLFGGASLGALAGGIGGGFGLGSLAGGFIQGALGKTGYGPQIGAGGGAIAGAAIGSVVPVIGTVVGALIGGLLGGAGGGLIGPPVKNKYSATSFLVDNGMLVTGTTGSQIYDSNLAQTQQELAQIDTVLQQLGLIVNSIELPEGKSQIVGYDAKRPDLAGSGMVAHSISEAFNTFRFASQDDPLLTQAIVGQQFADLNSLAQYVQQFKATQAGLRDFLANTIPQLVKFDAVGGTMAPQLAAINAQFDAATVTLRQYAASGAATAEQLAQLSQGETDLANARQRALQAVQDAARTQLQGVNDNLTARYLTAYATITGSPEDARTAALFAFDTQAAAQRQQFSDQMVATWGDAIKTTQGYVDELAYLDRTSWEERLATAKQFDDQISQAQKQALSSTVTSLAGFARSLTFGEDSALSPKAQYALASRQFDAVSGAALAGDFGSLQKLQDYAATLIQESRVVYGSGAGFAADQARVLDVLGKLTDSTAEQLTARFQESLVHSQTDSINATLNDGFAQLVAEVKALRTELRLAQARAA